MKLNECGNDSSKIYGQLNILLRKNNNSNKLPSGKLPLPLANDFKKFFNDKIDNTFTFLKKMNKTFCRNDAFDIFFFNLNN